MNIISSLLNFIGDRIETGLSVQGYTLSHSVPAGDSAQSRLSISKSDYYPIGIVGIDIAGTGSTWLSLFKFGLTGKSKGSAEIYVNLRNVNSSGTSSGTITVSVLWSKLGG